MLPLRRTAAVSFFLTLLDPRPSICHAPSLLLRHASSIASSRFAPAPSPDALQSSAALFFRRYRHATIIHSCLLQVPLHDGALQTLDHLGRSLAIDSHVVRSVLQRDLPLSVALGFFRWLEQRLRFVHDASTYGAMLDALGRAGRIGEMCAMLREMLDAGVQPKAGSLSRLISWCAKAKDVRTAIRLWNQASSRDIVSCNAMLDLLAAEKQHERAVELYLGIVERERPNAWTFAILIKLLVHACKLEAACLVLSILPKLNIRANAKTYAVLMKACAEAGDMGRLKQLVRDLGQVSHWRGEEFIPVVEALVGAGRMKEASLLAQEIWPDESWKERILSPGMSFKDEEDEPLGCAGLIHEGAGSDLADDLRVEGASRLGLSVVGLAEVLSCWTPWIALSLKQMNIRWDCRLAFQVIRKITDTNAAADFFYWLKNEAGLQHDSFTYTFLAIKLGRGRNFGALHDLLNHMEDDRLLLTVVSFNTLIRCCSIARKPREALDLFVRLERNGLHPDADTFAALIDMFSRERNVQKVVELYEMMQEARLQPCTVTFAQVIDCVGQTGATEAAQWVFDQMSEYDVEHGAHHYVALISAYDKAGDKEAAIHWYRAMQQHEIDIPKDSYPVLQRILQQCGQHGEAKVLANRVSSTQVRPSLWSRNDWRKAKGDRLGEQDLRLVYDILVQNLVQGTGLLAVGHK